MLAANPSIKLEIIYESGDLVVVNKPAGLTVHPLRPEQNDTLANALIARYPHIATVGDDPLRPGIVHRLDKDTSGLIIIAKNQTVFDNLKKQFQERTIEKKYLALVHGRIKDDQGVIAKAISFYGRDRKKRRVLLDKHSKPALSAYQVVKRFKDFTLVEVSPKTGRTHQIRVHLASIGHPVAGDQQYKFKRQKPPQRLTRQFLHAQHLKFRLTDGKMVELNCELPSDLKDILAKLDPYGQS